MSKQRGAVPFPVVGGRGALWVMLAMFASACASNGRDGTPPSDEASATGSEVAAEGATEGATEADEVAADEVAAEPAPEEPELVVDEDYRGPLLYSIPEPMWPAAHAAIRRAMAEDACELPPLEDLPAWTLPASSDPSRRAARRCRTLARRNLRALDAGARERWSQVTDERAEELKADFRDRFGECVGDGSGAWTFQIVDVSFDDIVLQVRAHTVYIDERGRVIREAEPATYNLEIENEEILRAPSLRLVHDFDGDGRLEAEHRVMVWPGGMGGAYTVSGLVRAGRDRIEEVPLPEGTRIGAWVDYDHDGLPDLRSPTPFAQLECLEASDPWPAPGSLLHGTPQGLRADDDAAERWLRAACPCAPTRLLARPRPDPNLHDHPLYSQNTLHRIACARIWGLTGEQVEARLAEETDALPAIAKRFDTCAYTDETLAEFGQQNPTMTLR